MRRAGPDSTVPCVHVDTRGSCEQVDEVGGGRAQRTSRAGLPGKEVSDVATNGRRDHLSRAPTIRQARQSDVCANAKRGGVEKKGGRV